MQRVSGRVFIMIAASGLLLAGCGNGGGSGQLESGSDYSVAGALAEIPADVSADATTIMTADLAAACEANGCQTPDDVSDKDAIDEWLSMIDGFNAETQTPVVVPLPESFGTRTASMAEFQEQLGWSVLDVDAFVGVEAPPEGFTVVAGDGIADLLSDDLVEVADGIVSTSDAEDLATSLGDGTPADQLGRPVRFAGDGDTLAASLTTPELEAWVDGPDATLADEEPLAAVAESLDEAGVAAAVLNGGGGFAAGDRDRAAHEDVEQLPASGPLPAAFDAVGLGWAADDEGDSVVTIAYHHESAEDAEANATALETLFTDGTEVGGKPMREIYTFSDAVTEDTVATVTVRTEVPIRIRVAYDDRYPPFVHA